MTSESNYKVFSDADGQLVIYGPDESSTAMDNTKTYKYEQKTFFQELKEIDDDELEQLKTNDGVQEYTPSAGNTLRSMQDAKNFVLFILLQEQRKIKLEGSMPVAWIAFTQTIFVLIVAAVPGIRFAGSVFTVVAQAAVVIASIMNHAPYLMAATRVSSAVAIGMMLLTILAWQSAYGIDGQIQAAFRAAFFTIAAFGIVSSNQFLCDIAESSSDDSLEQ